MKEGFIPRLRESIRPTRNNLAAVTIVAAEVLSGCAGAPVPNLTCDAANLPNSTPNEYSNGWIDLSGFAIRTNNNVYTVTTGPRAGREQRVYTLLTKAPNGSNPDHHVMQEARVKFSSVDRKLPDHPINQSVTLSFKPDQINRQVGGCMLEDADLNPNK